MTFFRFRAGRAAALASVWIRSPLPLGLLLGLVLQPRGLGVGFGARFATDGRGASTANDARPGRHMVDVWGGESEGGGGPEAVRQELERQLLTQRSPAQSPAQPPLAQVQEPSGNPFLTVGDVAVIAGADDLVALVSTGFAVNDTHFAALSSRFIASFGDDFHQIAVFLAFRDGFSPAALAYQQAIKNDDKGLGLGLFDHSSRFGSNGKLETILNMKRIGPYGRDASDDPDNALYPVWAQESAHRWLVYFRFQRSSDAMPSGKLLGRQTAHWTRFVQSDASIMDGYLWRDNGDGTYTPAEASKRWGALDQYGMGLRTAREVPPFFFLEDVVDENGNKVEMGRLAKTGRYTATRTDLTIADIVRAVGPREPALDEVARDMRMGVVLLGSPRDTAIELAGEAARIDHTRKLWTKFYDEAAGGRGSVCTQLERPCRGDAWRFEQVALARAPEKGVPGGMAIGPGEPFVLTATLVNVGTEAGKPRVKAAGRGRLLFGPELADAPASIAPGQSVTLTWKGRAANDLACGRLIEVDLVATGRQAPSRATVKLSVGLMPAATDPAEDSDAGWRVDPGGDDTAKQGRWAFGEPQETRAFDVVLQPGPAAAGRRAWVTGPSAEETDNVDGITTLESPPFSVTGMRAPHLQYRVHFVDAYLDNEVLRASGAGRLRVLASVDGGPFVEVDRVEGTTVGWQPRLVRLADALVGLEGARAVRVRFVAEEEGQKRPVVEAAIDDVAVTDEVASCDPIHAPSDGGATPATPSGGGCGCRLAGRTLGSSGAGEDTSGNGNDHVSGGGNGDAPHTSGRGSAAGLAGGLGLVATFWLRRARRFSRASTSRGART